jgi:CO/xanthine dehydrogenase FAD-binding subunit
MPVGLPTTLDDALASLAADPDAHVLAGGTDFMVEVNFGHRRPPSVLALGGVADLSGWRRDGDDVVLGAGLRWVDLEEAELAAAVPALAAAARTVGSPQIRNAGTLGGNIATASPAGDALPVLYALDAMVEVASLRGRRQVPLDEVIVGVKRTTLAADELIVSIRVPAARGPQEFLKVGTRNAMVISVASLALVVDSPARSVRCALGAVGPTVIRCTEAERYVDAAVDWAAGEAPAPVYEEFARLVAGAARPIDDHRSTVDYRRLAVEVMARRALLRAF